MKLPLLLFRWLWLASALLLFPSSHSTSVVPPSSQVLSPPSPSAAPSAFWTQHLRIGAGRGLEATDSVLTVAVNLQEGSYRLSVGERTWLSSGATALRWKNQWFSSLASSPASKEEVATSFPPNLEDGALRLMNYTLMDGEEEHLGPFTALVLHWSAEGMPFDTAFKVFEDRNVLTFDQSFPKGLSDCAVSDNSETISTFPSFSLAQPHQQFKRNSPFLNYFTIYESQLKPVLGTWPPLLFPGGIFGGVPLVLYSKIRQSIVLSPITNFMVGTHTISPHYNLQLSVGIQGKVQSLPSGFVHRTILVPTPPNESGGGRESEGGITAAIDEWGQVLRQMYGKAPADVAALNQPTTSYLGYWTDNGAYYYYTTEPGLSYEKTMIDIAKIAKKNALPFKHYQFDSWWYYKDQNGGLLLWEPRYDIFPSGMASLDEAMGFPPLVLHNRFFSAFNAYEDMGFKFIIEEENDISLPVDQKMFEYIMGTARLWGMSVYEQDWIIKTFSEMNATQNNIYNARHWLLAMGRAAATTGVTIQYCMTLPNAFLQSVEIPTVVQAYVFAKVRASHDYQPGNDNWKVTYTSMFLDALGLIPFKDNFWTTSKPQPGCKWPSTGCIEPNPELHALSAVLATGPVGPSDGIGYTNRSRIMKTCREDGLILKPDKPAKPLDTVFTAQFNTTAFSFVSQPINPLQVWVTSSRHQLRNNHNQHNFKWTVIDDEENEEAYAKWIYILAAGLPYQFNITPADLGLSDASSNGAKLYDFAQMEVADDDNFANAVHDFDAKHPLIIPPLPSSAPIVQHRYYVVCPVLKTSSWRWTFVGEINKFVPASKQRMRSISLLSHPKSGKEGIRVSVDGVPGEEVITLRFIAERKESTSSSFPLTIRCKVGSLAFIQVECTSLNEGTPSCTCSPSASSSSLSPRSRKSADKDGPRGKKKKVRNVHANKGSI